MKNLLITQCLQNDFVKPLAVGEPLPNQLHIGRGEANRLVGENIHSGPVGQFMAWLQQQDKNDDLVTIHIRDWHDPKSPQQASHLEQFGRHCIQNTAGAEFIFGAPLETARLINSTTLNDFEGTELGHHLNQFIEKTDATEKLRVGLIGVWTEAKILFLAYELSTRYPQMEIAVCSALTASSSRSQHFLALQQLERIVGVSVIDSMGEFIQFLGGQGVKHSPKNINQLLQLESSEAIVSDQETDELIRYLFRDCQTVSLKVLDGGFSGNLVAGTKSIDLQGHEQAAHVIKIGPRDLMAKERTAFEQIEMILGNNAPAIAEYADSTNKGAIKYRYASMGSGRTRSLQSCFQEGEAIDRIQQYLEVVFNEQLGKLYRATISDHGNLLDYYCFDAKWAESVKQKMEELITKVSDGDKVLLPGGLSVNNLYTFYKNKLHTLAPVVGDFPFAFIHGDLNGANIIVDGKDNIWLIDFFHTHRGHVLKDFAKLENDILYIYTSIENEDDLLKAYAFMDFLLSFKDPFVDFPALPEAFENTQFARAWQGIKTLRNIAGSYIESNSPHRLQQWLIPQLRYAVHTIGFDEPNRYQRIWALYTASIIAEKLTSSNSF